MWAIKQTVLVLILSSATSALAADTPKKSEYREDVEVRLVIVDVFVVDRHGRTVPDLTIEDFEVTVDGKLIELDTLDVLCPGGAMEDVVSVRRPSRRETPPAPEAERKILLAVDYMHIRDIDRARVLEDAQEMVRHGCSPGEQIMVAAITGGVRVEQPFTTDRDQVVEALHRMEYDITLWEPRFEHLTDFGFFYAVEALLNLMEQESGPKALVLFSNLPGDSSAYDNQYADLAALAATSRTAIYPVHAAGLRPPPPT